MPRPWCTRTVQNTTLAYKDADVQTRVPLPEAKEVTLRLAFEGLVRGHGPEVLLFGPNDAVVGFARPTNLMGRSTVEFLDFEERRYCAASQTATGEWQFSGSTDDEVIGRTGRRFLARLDRRSQRRVQFTVVQEPVNRGQSPIAVISIIPPYELDEVSLASGRWAMRNPGGDVVATITQSMPFGGRNERRCQWRLAFSDGADPRDRKVAMASAWVLYVSWLHVEEDSG